jgi:hypothetical protein
MTEFLIITNSFIYNICRVKNDVLLNNKEINLDMKYVLEDEKKDVIDTYNILVADGYPTELAAAKATLYFADYIETGESATIEFLDTLVLYLAGILKLPIKINEKYKKIKIIIDDNFIESANEKYEFNPHQSSLIPYNYKKLLINLLTQYF